MPPLQYDYLVVGLGAVVQFFGCTGAAENAFPLYTVEDALRLRSHIVERWEAADRDPSLVDDGALNVVVVGGGPTGIESVGALTELYRSDFAKDYRGVPAGAARLILVEAGPTLFPMFKPDIREYAQHELEERGVEIMLGERVEAVEPTRVKLASGTVLPAHTLVWGAGLQASPLAKSLGVELQKGNRVAVDPELRLPDHPEVFASATSPGSPTRAPATCCRSSARSRSRPASTPARTSRGWSPARSRSRSSTRTRARWRRSRAAPRWRSCTAGGR